MNERDWTTTLETGPEGKERLSNKKYATQVIQRDRLVSCLLEEVEEKYAGVIEAWGVLQAE